MYHLYVGGGEPSASWQDRRAELPVVTEDGTLHTGIDGGTVGFNIHISVFLLCGSGRVCVTSNWKYEIGECD